MELERFDPFVYSIENAQSIEGFGADMKVVRFGEYVRFEDAQARIEQVEREAEEKIAFRLERERSAQAQSVEAANEKFQAEARVEAAERERNRVIGAAAFFAALVADRFEDESSVSQEQIVAAETRLLAALQPHEQGECPRCGSAKCAEEREARLEILEILDPEEPS